MSLPPKARECRFWTGIQNERCKAGVSYRELADDSRPGMFLRLPCFTPTVDRKGNVPVECARFVDKTEEERQADKAEFDDFHAKFKKVLPVVSEWKKRPPIGKAEVIECPACGGKLHLVQSSRNGHVHGQCQTDNCVSWME